MTHPDMHEAKARAIVAKIITPYMVLQGWRIELVAAALREAEAAAVARTKREDAEVTPKMIAAAWAAWRSRHGGRLGPGPAFVEAIRAAILASTEKPNAE